MSGIPSAHQSLGIAGFTFADLHQPARLGALYELYSDEFRRAEPDLWAQWEAHRANPTALNAIAQSNLIVAVAPHVTRFLTRLFAVGPEVDQMTATTRAYDALFRFKIDFVRRRALPLLKGGTAVQATADDHARVESAVAGALDPELALAEYGCALLDRDEVARTAASEDEKAAVATEIESLKRWCAAHLHDRRFHHWVVFRFPETLDPIHLVRVVRPEAALPELMVGPEEKLRRRDGFKLTDERFTTREVLSEIHYCVLCHERDKDTCSKGIRDKTGAVTTNALGIALAGCPLDEKISEMHALRKRGDAIGALAIVTVDNPDVPRHRPPHLQRLHEGVHLPEAGSGQHPADRNRRAH